ncbi:MAG: VCBS repeat-containing protein [Chloroflexota bacterium]
MYLNQSDGTFSDPILLDNTMGHATNTIALGDLNGDGALDIVTGHYAGSLIYYNQDNGTFSSPVSLDRTQTQGTNTVALGDLNGDGTLDIVTGHYAGSLIYYNQGSGTFSLPVPLGDSPGHATNTIALGDLNGDGALDIVAGNDDQPNIFYLNRRNNTFSSPQYLNDGQNKDTRGIALGDLNGDGALDIVAGNDDQLNTFYLNEGAGTFTTAQFLDSIDNMQVEQTGNIALGDLNGDGALDIVANGGSGAFRPAQLVNDTSVGQTKNIALGDLNGNDALDVDTKNIGTNRVYFNTRIDQMRLPNNPSFVTVTRPGNTGNANFFSTAEIISDTNIIEIPYTLFDHESDPVRAVNASYSLDGGGQWLPAVADQAPGLVASPDGTDHVFHWNLFESGFFGASDNVVFRLIVYPAHNVTGPFVRPYASATTFPFRVRGTQVQVIDQSTSKPVTGAHVYRLPDGQTRDAQPLVVHPTEPPSQTNTQGHLPGRNMIKPNDQLVAFRPITSTDTYTLYHTSAAVTSNGLNLTPVEKPGTQTLAVSSDNALLLFNLTVSLEWDARQDQQYLLQLEDDLKRTSELLFDWSDGQIALGHITVYQHKEYWDNAHIRVYATNQMRPSATKGGIVEEGAERPDPTNSEVIYRAGQIRMGAVWNRYGDADASLGEDWPRALAHEIGHFALFLDDNYLGIKNRTLVSVDSCPGAMSDPYLPDNDEFHPRDTRWEVNCQQTLSEYTTSRADWETIKVFYDQPDLATLLRAPKTFNAQRGPNQLPLAVTQVAFVEVAQDDMPLDAPIFRITDNTASRWRPGPNTRAVLFQNNQITDLGKPTHDQILARGAHIGDRLCIYDLDVQRLGCQTITADQRELPLDHPTWQPDIRLTPVTSTTLEIEVHDPSITKDDIVWAQIYPATTTDGTEPFAFPPVQLQPAHGNDNITTFESMQHRAEGELYLATITTPLDQPTFEGHLHIWVNDQDDASCPNCREAVVDYLLGGNPGLIWGRTAPRGNPGLIWGRTAPILSSDGQAIVYSDDVNPKEGEFFTFQSAVRLPPSPSWANPVGRAYRLIATSATMLDGISLNIGYQGDNVPNGEEAGIQMYVWDEDAAKPSWTPLNTHIDIERNQASAQIVGPGVYMLMSSITIPLESRGWQLIPYPGQTQAVPEALAGIEDHYTTVYGYEPTDSNNPWRMYDVDVPAWVNDLDNLGHQHAYWINVTQPTKLPIKGPRSQRTDTTLAATTAIPQPPATYYMKFDNDSRDLNQAGLPVVARMGGQVCGITTTRVIEDIQGGVGFVIDVVNTDICDGTNRTVTFTVDGEILPLTAMWNNQRPQQLTIFNNNPTQIYLPLLQR